MSDAVVTIAALLLTLGVSVVIGWALLRILLWAIHRVPLVDGAADSSLCQLVTTANSQKDQALPADSP